MRDRVVQDVGLRTRYRLQNATIKNQCAIDFDADSMAEERTNKAPGAYSVSCELRGADA